MDYAYAGIGSRNCPENIIKIIIKLGRWLSLKGYTLRSGAADGCDTAFEKGCDLVKGKKEIYIPWKNFNNSDSELIVKNKKAFEIAAKYHPNYEKLSLGVKKLQARYSHQILGLTLDNPVKFVICYTKNGLEIGGTSQALRIAKDYNIPIFNLGKYKNIDECRKAFLIFFEKVNKKNNMI